MRVVVESLAEEFDVVDIAAAAVKIAHAARGGDGKEKEIELPQGPPKGGPHERAGGTHDRRAGSASNPANPAARTTTIGARLWIGAGRKAGIRPGRPGRGDYWRSWAPVDHPGRHRNQGQFLAGRCPGTARGRDCRRAEEIVNSWEKGDHSTGP